MAEEPPPLPTPLSLADLWEIFRPYAKKIRTLVLGSSLLGAFLALSLPVEYLGEATFREKTSKGGGVGNVSLLQLVSGETGILGPYENEAKSTFKSRTLLEQVVKTLHLQARLTADREEREWVWHRIQRHLLGMWGVVRQDPFPSWTEKEPLLEVGEVMYESEVPVEFWIDLQPTGAYSVRRKKTGEELVQGILGERIQVGEVAFLLRLSGRKTAAEAAGGYQLSISSPARAAKELGERVRIEPDKEDKNLLHILVRAKGRKQASQLANTWIEAYQKYLKEIRDHLSKTQIRYLHERQQQLSENLQLQMERHAHFLAHDLFPSGFVHSEKEMDFLSRSQQEYREKLLANQLEIQRLETLQPERDVYYEAYVRHAGDSDVINALLQEIRTFKQKRDGLEIEMQKRGDPLLEVDARLGSFQTAFSEQMDELSSVQLLLREVQDLSDRFRQGLGPDPDASILREPRFLVQDWLLRLQGEGERGEKERRVSNFQFYLANLERLFLVQEKMLKERLSHQQNPAKEFRGIALHVAEELYGQYCSRIVEEESHLQQYVFLLRQMQEPAFEITSFSSCLEDPVSQELIHKTGQIALALRDGDNRTLREKERLQEELSLHRRFFQLHLQQMGEVSALHQKLLREKTEALQAISLELIHQQISLLEQTLREYIASRLENLREDRLHLQQHLERIRQELALLPKKWMAEQLLEQEVATNQLIVEEIAKMVESKNIAHQMNLVQSAPLDLAIPPLHPISPPLLLYMLFGAFGSGMLSLFWVFGRHLSREKKR